MFTARPDLLQTWSREGKLSRERYFVFDNTRVQSSYQVRVLPIPLHELGDHLLAFLSIHRKIQPVLGEAFDILETVQSMFTQINKDLYPTVAIQTVRTDSGTSKHTGCHSSEPQHVLAKKASRRTHVAPSALPAASTEAVLQNASPLTNRRVGTQRN